MTRAGSGITVGIVGTFDVANFGDLLFPELAAHELGRRVDGVELRRYSHRPMSAPPWAYDVRTIEELIATIDDLALLVVGGGHLVRFDTTVAPGYESVASGVPHPTGYWLSPTLVAAAAGVPVAWNAIGASLSTPEWARSLVAAAAKAADYVSVRDGASLAELAEVAPSAFIRLVPDTAFGIRDLLRTRPAGLPSAALSQLVERPYVIVQASRGLRAAVPALRAALPAVRDSGFDVVELPVSPVLGDRGGVLGDLGVTTVRVDAWPEPIELARLIAGAQAVVVHSLHASIVALAHGIPVFRASMPAGSKYGHLATFPGVVEIGDGGELAEALVGATPGSPSTQVLECAAQLEAHWSELARLLRANDDQARSRRVAAARRLLAGLPGVIGGADASNASLRLKLTAAEEERRALAAQRSEAVIALSRAADRTTALAEQVVELQVALDRERHQSGADRRRLEQELARHKREAATLRGEVRDLRPKAAALDRLRRRRLFRAALVAVGAARRVTRSAGSGMGRLARGAPGERAMVRATPEMEQAVARALREAAPGSPRASGPLVSIVILNRNGVAHLQRLLPALAATSYRTFELIIVDNASTDESVAFLQSGIVGTIPLTLIQNDENRSFSDANNQAAARASGDLLLFLNNDVEPLGPGWLGRMVDTHEAEAATAVGARLVYPRRPALENAGDRQFPDLTLQHRGITFEPADGVPTGRNLGTGTDPLGAEASRAGDVPAVTAACLLVRRPAFEAVGGFTSGFVYGTEDVDLNVKLRAAGGRIVYEPGAVLWHHEYGTQNANGREWKRSNRTRNRQLFVDRWAPQIFREVFRDRVAASRRWSEAPLAVAITLTRDDPAAGWGDYYTAHELGDALATFGWQVTYAERHQERWYELDPGIDVVISLLDAFDVRRIPRGIVTVAWVRNWTDRWVDQPWFDEHDIVLASSRRSQEIIEARSSKRPALMPLATNPDKFVPAPPVPELRADVVFTGNHWGSRRGVEDLLPAVAEGRTVAVHGRSWEGTALAPYDRGSLPYELLPAAYASARIVLDDTAGPTLPYGAVNSRVFDALAAGAFVVTDNEDGSRELFDGGLPVALDAAQLESHLKWVEENPAAAAELQATLRGVVLKRHTYSHRAAEIRDHLLAWADADRYAILIGAPDWDQATVWGDYHFARALQRQLERRGHPTRVHILPDWERAPAARADVAIHLHGLSDHRPRASQLNILWVISHPDRLTPQVCERYDLVLVASERFAAELAGRVRVPIVPLHQATDPERMALDPSGPAHDLLFVGNTRGVRRAIVDDLTPTTHDLAVYGTGWVSDIIDPIHVRGDYVDNRALGRLYASAKIVLADHWPDMRSHGFIANRLYDALASGAFVISDHVPGIEEEFDGGVVTYTDREELHRLVEAYLRDADARRRIADRGRRAVLARHTFAHRVDTILAQVDAISTGRPRDVSDWTVIQAWLERRARRAATGRALPAPPSTHAAPGPISAS